MSWYSCTLELARSRFGSRDDRASPPSSNTFLVSSNQSPVGFTPEGTFHVCTGTGLSDSNMSTRLVMCGRPETTASKLRDELDPLLVPPLFLGLKLGLAAHDNNLGRIFRTVHLTRSVRSQTSKSFAVVTARSGHVGPPMKRTIWTPCLSWASCCPHHYCCPHHRGGAKCAEACCQEVTTELQYCDTRRPEARHRPKKWHRGSRGRDKNRPTHNPKLIESMEHLNHSCRRPRPVPVTRRRNVPVEANSFRRIDVGPDWSTEGRQILNSSCHAMQSQLCSGAGNSKGYC